MKYWERSKITDRISEIKARQHVIDWNTLTFTSRPLTSEEEDEVAGLYAQLDDELTVKQLESICVAQGSCGKILPVFTYEEWRKSKENLLNLLSDCLGNNIRRLQMSYRYLKAVVIHPKDEDEIKGVVVDEYLIFRGLKFLSEQTKNELLSRFLDTRRDRFLVLFPDGHLKLFRPDDVEVTWHEAVA